MKHNQDIIAAARAGFDPLLHTAEYHQVHSDDSQLERLLDLATLRPGARYADLGTGNGYVAFALAHRRPDISVVGVDIAAISIEKNNTLAREQGLANISFVAYDGAALPFAPGALHGMFSRYALHHFPDISASFAEIARVLEPGGFFVLSDPCPHDLDTDCFIDRFQQLQPDGHVHFYRETELSRLATTCGLQRESGFASEVRYPREMSQAYRDLLATASQPLRDAYRISLQGDQVYITVPVANTLFRKDKAPAG